MKKRISLVDVSALILSVCLLSRIHGALRFASTWKDIFQNFGCINVTNLLAPLGIQWLGTILIGLIVLATGYRRRERSAWVIMLLILLFAFFPLEILPALLEVKRGTYDGAAWLNGIQGGFPPSVALAQGVASFVLMSLALLLPIRKFFGRKGESAQA